MNKIAQLSRENKKLFNEVMALIILAIIFIGFSVFNSASRRLTPTTSPQAPIETDFNTQPLEEIRKTDSDIPNLSPGNVGKSNPFAL